MTAIDDAITALTTEVANTEGVEESAVVAFQGVPALIATAVAAAQAAGATPAQLQSFTDLNVRLRASATKLAAAVAAEPAA